MCNDADREADIRIAELEAENAELRESRRYLVQLASEWASEARRADDCGRLVRHLIDELAREPALTPTADGGDDV
jgi:hypothetical protein